MHTDEGLVITSWKCKNLSTTRQCFCARGSDVLPSIPETKYLIYSSKMLTVNGVETLNFLVLLANEAEPLDISGLIGVDGEILGLFGLIKVEEETLDLSGLLGVDSNCKDSTHPESASVPLSSSSSVGNSKASSPSDRVQSRSLTRWPTCLLSSFASNSDMLCT